MSIDLFVIIFTVLAILTPLFVEAVNMLLKDLKAKIGMNLIVLAVSVILSLIAMIFIYLQRGIPFNAVNCFYILFMVLANWLGSMVGYDKVKQAFEQIKKR